MKVIKLKGYVGWDITASYLERELPKNGDDVYLTVDSFGGSVYEGNRLYNTIYDHVKNPDRGKITVEFGAVAASAASYFPLAVGLENIGVRKNTTFMGHKAWAFMLGNADELREEANILDGFDKIIATVYSDFTGRKVNIMLNEMAKEMWFIGGQAVIDGGFASFMIDETEESDLSDLIERDDELEIVDQAIIRARIEEGKIRLRENGVKEDLKKWAASLKTELVNVSKSAPLNADGNIKTEEFKNMKLNEFLEKNPEAKAEYEKNQKTAYEAAGKVTEKAVEDERVRINKLINLSGFNLPESLSGAINSGETLGVFMEKEITVRNLKLKDPGNNQELGKLEDSNQLPGEGEDKKLTGRWDKAVNKRLGKSEEGAK